MSDNNLVQLAKQGDQGAIANLIERSLLPLGIHSITKLNRGCLYVFVESLQVPEPTLVMHLLRQGLLKLQVKSIKTVKVYGRQTGENMAAWTQEFDLVAPHHSPYQLPVPKTNFTQNGKKYGEAVNSNSSISEEKNSLEMATPPLKKVKKSSVTFRYLEIFFWVGITFVLTTLLWDRLGLLKIINSKTESSHILAGFLNQINPKKTIISGGAWVTKEGGNSDILRGLEIVLCKASVKSELVKIRDNKWRESIAKYKTSSGYLHLNMNAMNSKVAAHKDCFQIVKTGIEGKYTIPDVPFGSYLLYAPYETTFSKAYWMIPIEVDSSKPLQIDLDNSNMMELYNK